VTGRRPAITVTARFLPNTFPVVDDVQARLRPPTTAHIVD